MPLLVPLVEEGWVNHPVTDAVLAEYLDPLLAQQVDTLVLGCTHYPLLLDELVSIAPWPVQFIDPAPAIAKRVADVLRTADQSRSSEGPSDGTVFFTSARGRNPESLSAYAAIGFVQPDIFEMPV